jgi:cyclic pyranopterin phosphate synthase
VVVRFIEFMPLDADGGWTEDSVVTLREIVERIGSVHPVEAVAQGSEPAARWRYLDGGGEFGVIASVTRAFCGSCDRIRLSAEGGFRNCLFAVQEQDLRTMLRQGATDDELAAVLRHGVADKWAGHHIGQVHFIRPSKSMSQIGG